MSSAPRESGQPGDDAAWDDIVSRLDGEVFTDVPDIISTGQHPSMSANAANGDTQSADDEQETADNDPDAFIPPDPPPIRLSRNTKIGWSCLIGGPLIYAGSDAVGLLDDAVQVLSFGLLIGGAFMLLRNLTTTQPDDEDSAPV